MSVDNRVVQMQFDNKQFETGVSTSIKSINELKNGLNMDGASKSLMNLERVGKSFTLDGIAQGVDHISSKFSALGIIGITVLQNLTNSALNFGKKMMSSMLDPLVEGGKKRALNIEQAKFQFKGLGMDVEATMASALTAVRGTAYGLDEAAVAASQFGATGMRAGDEMTSALRAISGVAAMTGSSYSDMSQIFTTVAGNGRLMGSELLRLSSRGINAAATLGKAYGKTEAQIREMVSKGKISFEMFYKAMDGAFGQHATSANETYTGSLSNMRAALARIGAAISTNSFESQRKVLNALTPVIDNVHTALKPLIESLNELTRFNSDNMVEMLKGLDLSALELSIPPGIEIMKNVFQGLMSVLIPVKQAFLEIFPAMKSEQIVAFVTGIRDLTVNFKMGYAEADNLKRTFKGLFAVLDMGLSAFSAIGKGLMSVIQYLLPAGSGLLAFTGNIGDFLVALNKASKASDFFNVAVQKIGEFIKPIADRVKLGVISIIDTFKAFNGVDLSGLDSFSDRVKARLEPFTIMAEFVGNVFSKIVGVIKKFAPILYRLAEIVGNTFSKMSENILIALDNAEFETIFDIINSGLFAGILLGLTKFIDAVTKLATGASGITGVLAGVRGALYAYQNTLKANVILTIAIAVGILSAALVALSLVDSAKLTVALGAMTVMIIDLFAAMVVFQKLMGASGFKSMAKITTAMIGLSIGVLILSVAMKKLADLDWNGIAKGLTAVATLSAILVVSATALSKSGGRLIKGSAGFILFAVAINILASAVEKLSMLEPDALVKGLVSVGALMAQLAIFMKVTNLSKMGVLTGVGLIALAFAINVMADAVKKFGDLNASQLEQGLIAMGVVLAQVAIFANITGHAKHVLSSALSLTILGAAMLIFASAIEKLGVLSWEQIGKGLSTMAGVLLMVAVALNLMPKSMIFTATGLVIVASALLILSKALSSMGGMSWEEIGKGLLTLAGSLTIISVAMLFMTTALPGAAALLIIAAALSILVPVLKSLGGMSLKEIGFGLLALAGVFAVIGVAGLVLGPLVPVLLALAGAMVLFGIACVAVGAGALTFSAGLAALAVSGTAGAAALVVIVTAIIGLIPLILVTLAQGIVDFAKVLGEGASVIGEGIMKIVVAVVKKIVDITPVIVKGLMSLITTMLKVLVEYVPIFVDAGMKILIGLLKGISDNIQAVVEVAGELMINFLAGITTMIPKIIQAGVDLILSFINGVAEAIRGNTEQLMNAMDNLMTAMFEAGVKVLKGSISKFFAVGKDIIDSGFVKGLKEKAVNFVPTLRTMATDGIKALTDKISDFTDVGKNLVDGFIGGIRGKIEEASKWAANLATSTLDAAKTALDINSPSKRFEKEVGEMIGKGMAAGIKNSAKRAKQESSKMAKEVVEAAKEWIDERKYYNKISLQEELYVWEQIQAKYKTGTKERTAADREAYRLKNEMIKEEYNNSIKWMDEKKYYNQLSIEHELAGWERMQKKYVEGTEERKRADREVYRLKNDLIKEELSNSIKWIDERKYYNQLSLIEELAAWERVQARYIEGTEERKRADREVYRVNQEINNKRKTLEDEYYSKTKAINERLISDIKSLNDAYESALKSRTDSLYRAYGLFDSVSVVDEVDGKVLISNLDAQLKAVDAWKSDMNDLAAKGVNEGLIKELQAMGPQSAAQIKALNSLSSSELNNYVDLWQIKHEQAKTQAISELEDLRIETKNKISIINTETQSELNDLRNEWTRQMTQLNSETQVKLVELTKTWDKNVNTLKVETESKFTHLGENIRRMDWPGVGVSMIAGISAGVQAEAGELARVVADVAKRALDAAKDVLDINSPSKKFEEVGKYSIQGMVVGLRKFSGDAISEAAIVGYSITDALKSALINVADLVNGDLDLTPTIRPVIDLSDVKMGVKDLNSVLGADSKFNVSNSLNKAKTITRPPKDVDAPTTAGPTEKSISFTQNNYSPKPLSRLEIYRNTKNQFAAMKGVLNGA